MRGRSSLPDRACRTARRALIAALATLGLSLPAAAAGLADIIDELDPHPCYAGRLTCVTVTVPLDHKSPGDNRTLDIEFAVHEATGEYRGTLIYFVGGPGQSGVPFGSPAMRWFDPGIPEHYDVIFFDQRGTGPRHGVECLEASKEYWTTHWNFDDLDAVVGSVQKFVADCVTESGRAAILPYLSTEQAAFDVEAFRQAIGAPKLWLYGASYGTYIAQVYAAMFPDAVDAVILDAVMDPAVDLAVDSARGADAAEALFLRVAEECAREEYCQSSFLTDPLAAYDRLMAELERAPIEVMFPLTDGTLERRMLTPEMMFGALSMSLYTPFDRSTMLHVLAMAEHGDFVPLTRMGYRSLELDPDTLQPSSAENSAFGVYWGAFYAISCADYALPDADPAAAARADFEAGLDRRDTHPRFFGYLIGIQPECRFWPTIGDGSRPPLFEGGDYKTLILAADADAATPIVNARDIYERIDNASMVTVVGGPHVVYGWGETCVDNVVTRWLVDGKEPDTGNRTCHQPVIDANRLVDVVHRYDPDTADGLAWGIIAGIESAAMSAGWYEWDPLQVGCSYGGTMVLRPLPGNDYVRRYRMEACAIWPGLEVTGIAVYRDMDDQWGWEMTLDLAGVHTGNLTVAFDFRTDEEIVEGVLDGADVEYASYGGVVDPGTKTGASGSAGSIAVNKDQGQPSSSSQLGSDR